MGCATQKKRNDMAADNMNLVKYCKYLQKTLRSKMGEKRKSEGGFLSGGRLFRIVCIEISLTLSIVRSTMRKQE